MRGGALAGLVGVDAPLDTPGNPELVSRMGPLKEGLTSCVPPFVQMAGLAALREGAEFTSQLKATFETRRDAVLASVSQIDGIGSTFWSASSHSSLSS